MPAAKLASPVLELATPAAWRTWLRANHARSAGVFLRIPKVVKAVTCIYMHMYIRAYDDRQPKML